MAATTFESKLISVKGWDIVRLPVDVSKRLPTRSQVMVHGSLNGHEFLTALEPDGMGGHWLYVTPDMQAATGLKPGSTANVAIEVTNDWPEPKLPADLQAAIEANPDVQALWADVTPRARWEWIRWVGATANSETRAIRIRKTLSKLRSGLRRPCCFNLSACTVPEVSKSGVLLETANA